MTPDEFRTLGHQLIEWVAAYRERLAELPVMSPVGPGDVRRHFASAPPMQGVPLGEVLPLLDQAILPASPTGTTRGSSPTSPPTAACPRCWRIWSRPGWARRG